MEKLIQNYPSTVESLLSMIESPNTLPQSFFSLLSECVGEFYSQNYERCVDLSEPLLDYIWEKLNTGYWKDVHISWRYSYTVVSLVKGLSQFYLLKSCSSVEFKHTDYETVLRTLDMGILMGAPILDNILARLSAEIHKYCDGEAVDHGKSCDYKDGVMSSTSRRDTDDLPREENSDLKDESSFKEHPFLNSSSFADSKQDQIPALLNSYLDEPSRCKRVKIDIKSSKMLEDIEKISCPSLETFKKLYFDCKKPVILTDCMNHWPAMSDRMWSLDYLTTIAGYRTVPIEIGSKYTDESWTQKLMTLKEFIDKHVNNMSDDNPVGYLAQHQLFDQIPELQNDIIVPDYCSVGHCQEDVSINAWFGPKGTISPLHYDPKHNFLAQVVGQKYIQLYSEEMSTYLYPNSGFMENTSQVDVENPNLTEFPLYSKVTGFQGVIEPGHMLYIPQKWWHFVKSLSVSFSVSFWWL